MRGKGAPETGAAAFAKPTVIGHYLFVQAAATLAVAAACGALAAGIPPSVNASSVLFSMCIGWMLYSWAQVAGTIATPYWLFVFVAALFNGGHSLLEVFGLNPNGVMESRFSIATTSSTIMYSTLSMMLLHVGALWRASRQPALAPAPEPEGQENAVVRLGLVLILIAAVPMFLQLREDFGDVLSVGYFGLYQRVMKTNLDAWQSILAQFLLPGVFLLTAASRQRPGMRRLSLVIIAIYVLSYMFLGYRSAAGAAIAAYGWIWHTRVAKLPLYPSLAAGFVFVFLVFPMIRLHRTAVGEDRLSWSGFVNTLEDYDNPATASLTEMGSTMSTIAYTMDLVPSDREFEYGQSYLFAALTVLPNVFGTALHPAIEHGTASSWLVRTISYDTAAAGGGMGYSFIAEAYLNFGWAGPPLVMILMGFGFASVECFAARSASPAAAALMGVVTVFGLIYARAEMSNVVRPIIWCGFVPLGVLAMFVKRRKRLGERTLELPSSAPQVYAAPLYSSPAKLWERMTPACPAGPLPAFETPHSD
jgi:oligosaccharide repeat unit polymerase